MSVNERRYRGPLPSSDFDKMLANEVMPPMVDFISGEIHHTPFNSGERMLGIARYSGKIKSVNMSVLLSGKHNTNVPTIEADVFINRASCLTTKPRIQHVSGEASQQKTTYTEAGDTGITRAVVNESAGSITAGDVLTWRAYYSGEVAPTSKPHGAGIIVEFDPAD